LFIGRTAELDRLAEYQNDALCGKPRVVMVQGSAGYGKTAFLGRVELRLDAWHRWATSCDDAEARLPFGLVRRLVRHLESQPDTELTERLAAPATPDPFEIGSRLVQVIGDAQESAPLAVLVDDAGYADLPSLQAMAFALRRLETERTLVVLSGRPEALRRAPQGLLKLAQDRERVVELRGLNAAETRRLVAELGGGVISGRAARRLVDHTGGSPLHLRALIAELPPDELARTSGPLPAPRSFSALVAEAADACSPRTARLLSAAAALGGVSPLRTVADVGEVEDPRDALEEAVHADLATATHRDGEWLVGFPHPLIRSAIYEGIGPATRARLHRRAACLLGGVAALEHRVAAADGPDAELVRALREQADVETRQNRTARAADLLLSASRLSATATDREQRLLEAVDSLLTAGEVGEAAGYSATIADMPPSPERLLVQARLAWLSGQSDAENLARRVWISCGSSALGGGAAAMVAQCRVLDDDGPGAAKWSARALECSDLAPDSAMTARMNLATGLLISGLPEKALAVVENVPEPSATDVLPRRWLRGDIRLWMDDLLGSYDDLRPQTGESVAAATSPNGLMRLGFLGHVEYRLGRWSEALHHAEQTVSLVVDTNQTWLLGFAHSMAVYVFAGRGLWAEAAQHVAAARAAAERLGDQASFDFATNVAVHLAHCRGDAEAVVAAAEPLRRRRSIGVHDPGAFDWRRRCGAALITLKRLDEADDWLAQLRADCERRRLPLALAEVGCLQGDLAAARRLHEQAREAYEAALGLDPDGLEPFAHARIEAAYGRFLRRTGERRAATERLGQAREVFLRLDARPDLDRCTAELAANGVAVEAPQLRIDARLTPQERAVARLVCGGRSNREVAAELVLSVKTVGYHLQNVYTKLGVNSRTQLLALLGPSAV
jgi:DNA-binding CsgD family transcriptional regulator